MRRAFLLFSMVAVTIVPSACDKSAGGPAGPAGIDSSKIVFARLEFLTQPASIVDPRRALPTVRVRALDAKGNVVTGSHATIKLVIMPGSGTPGAVMGGVNAQNIASGIAEYTGLVIDTYGKHYVLQATSTVGDVTATSAPFDIWPAPDPAPEPVTIYVSDLPSGRMIRFDDMGGTNWQSTPVHAYNAPWHFSLDASGRIYVAERDLQQVVRTNDLSGAGRVIFGPQNLVTRSDDQVKSAFIDPAGRILITAGSRVVRINDMNGAGRVEMNIAPPPTPKVAITDALGRIYISDTDGNAIIRINNEAGDGLLRFGTGGAGVGQFNRPEGLALDAANRIYITDNENHRIVRIDDMNGTGWVAYGTLGDGVGQFREPHDLAISPTGRIYVADAGNQRIVRINDMSGAGWVTFGTNAIRNFCPGLNCDAVGQFEFTAPKGLRLRPR